MWHCCRSGFESAISEFLSENYPTRVVRLGINDKFGQSGTAADLLCEYGLTVKHLISKIKESMDYDRV